MRNMKPYLKTDRAVAAQEHYKQMSDEFSMDIRNSIHNSKVYRHIGPYYSRDSAELTKVYFENLTTTKAAMKHNLEENGKCCLLNFASFTNPGGGFLKGAMAQEEALCNDSTLYNVLENFKSEYEFNKNPKLKNNGLYSDFAIYSPNIVFINPDDPTYVFDYDVLTCPAPNKKVYLEKTDNTTEYYAALLSRIKFLLTVAAENDVDTLVLGAFGCGVFGNTVADVAKAFMELIYRYNFSHIIFAIPDNDKLEIFKKAYNNYNSNSNYEK